MKFYKKEDFKTSLKIKLDDYLKKALQVDAVYLVPFSKNYNNIKPQDTNKYDMSGDYIIASDSNYNGMINIFNNGVFRQYRDGCFNPYIGKVAI